MNEEHPTRIPFPTSGSNRIHTSIITFAIQCPTPSQGRVASPTRSDLENAYRASTDDEAAPNSDELLSLNEILAAPAPTPLERAMARPLSSDFDQVVNFYDREGGWSQRGVKKGGLSNLRIAHDAREFLGGELGRDDDNEDDDEEMWSEAEKGREKEGYEGAAAALLASLEEVAALQAREAEKGFQATWREKLGLRKKGKMEISWPVGDGVGSTGAMALVEEGAEALKRMAEQARVEGRDARVEQIALRVRDLVHSLSE